MYYKMIGDRQVFSTCKTIHLENDYPELELHAGQYVSNPSAELIAAERKIYKGVSANIDFYSGFVYSMLGIPMELYTPLFAIARISGWSAHRIEELNGKGKIIRPAYKSVQPREKYYPLGERK